MLLTHFFNQKSFMTQLFLLFYIFDTIIFLEFFLNHPFFSCEATLWTAHICMYLLPHLAQTWILCSCQSSSTCTSECGTPSSACLFIYVWDIFLSYQHMQYLSCYCPYFDETFMVGYQEHLEQILTVTVTFVSETFVPATFVHIRNISDITELILTKL